MAKYGKPMKPKAGKPFVMPPTKTISATVYVTRYALVRKRRNINGRLCRGILRYDHCSVYLNADGSINKAIPADGSRGWRGKGVFLTKEEAIAHVKATRLEHINWHDMEISRLMDLDITKTIRVGGNELDELLDMVEEIDADNKNDVPDSH